MKGAGWVLLIGLEAMKWAGWVIHQSGSDERGGAGSFIGLEVMKGAGWVLLIGLEAMNNFNEFLPLIEKSIFEADFVAIDCEFTGLHLPGEGPSLFDSGADRYAKLRRAVQAFMPSQIGISAFVRDKNSLYYAKYCVDLSVSLAYFSPHISPFLARYEAHTYNFFIFPLSFGPIDVQFSCQFVYEGISVLNEEQEKTLSKHLRENELFSGLIRDVDESSLQSVCLQVTNWLNQSPKESEFFFTIPPELPEYIIIKELRQRFSNIWITAEKGKILVQRVTTDERIKMEEDSKQAEEKKITKKMLGFTQVFRSLIKSKKPLIGHNCFTDLLFLYEKCYQPLPESYLTYKAKLHTLFPIIYDTKSISSGLRKTFDSEGYFNDSKLSKLFENLTGAKTPMLTLCNPEVNHHPLSSRYKTEMLYHEAGFDAYMTGLVFLQTAHIVHYEAYRHLSSEMKAPSFHQYSVALKQYVNEINLIRASVQCIRLGGDDPPVSRPHWLHVTYLHSPMHPNQLACLLSAHGAVDVQADSHWSALVAVPNFTCGKAILKAYKQDNTLRITRYIAWKHNPVVTGCLGVGLIVSTSLCVWVVYSTLK
ncbi:hypothetical protein CAPTEDRAFT_222843 [Capitella teleta]|uniref:Uncharacterized protein n=1 Tax=Capitella teleta TaxID=283909 RepID=R7T383_CAPTE|nr:hypothetical protein CAPTEDRAFT_222843 [Capitella teleta]|eukprot:ELT87068.1 hypothetical protein CAPTEDRAFT_222843 [Capitella teleta]